MPVLLDLDKHNPIVDERFKIYDVVINDNNLRFEYSKSHIDFDSDGDAYVKLKIDTDYILDSIKVDEIINYLTNMDYEVTKQD